jgi:hypothetical protein
MIPLSTAEAAWTFGTYPLITVQKQIIMTLFSEVNYGDLGAAPCGNDGGFVAPSTEAFWFDSNHWPNHLRLS